jgi:hypothetical protein
VYFLSSCKAPENPNYETLKLSLSISPKSSSGVLSSKLKTLLRRKLKIPTTFLLHHTQSLAFCQKLETKFLETINLLKEELMAKLQRLDCKKKSEGVKGVEKSSRV